MSPVTEPVVPPAPQGAGGNDSAAAVGVVAGQEGVAHALLHQLAAAAYGAGEHDVVVAVHDQRAGVRDRAGHAACPAAIAQLQRAGRDRGAAGVGIVGGQHRGAGAGLRDRAAAADQAAEGIRVGAVEHQRAVVGDVADDAARRAARAQLQCARRDRGAARVVAVARQHRRAAALLRDAASAADEAAKGVGIAAVEHQRAIVGDVAADAARRPARPELQGPGGNQRAAGVVAVAGQHGGA